MIFLIVFAFLAGVVTVLSPCILPLLPIILSSADGSRQKPLGVVTGFVASFVFFTLFLSSLVQLSGISANSLRLVSIFVLAGFGITLLVPQVQARMEILFSRLAGMAPTKARSGYWGGVVIGLSLGLLWTPCVGPILASVISLAISGTVTTQAFVITLAYAMGTAIPMFGIMMAGSTALRRVPWLVRNTGKIQKAFGVLMILTAVAIYFNIDRQFQTFILETFPSYGTGLTALEDNDLVRRELEKANDRSQNINVNLDERGVQAPELIPGGEWFNSEPLTLSELKGKVVLVDFWTYSCINCQRTFPYLRTWWEKYKDKGLVIIGVHAPEFEFEKNASNLKKAISDFGLEYPIMQDNNFATWRSYDNHYWPAKYLIDVSGNIRYYHYGEGKYDETERAIQLLLEEAGMDAEQTIDNAQYNNYSRTPETYLGADKPGQLSSPEGVQSGFAAYTSPAFMPVNTYSLEGSFRLSPEYLEPTRGSKLHLDFEAREVFLVARSKAGEGKMKVYLDGELQAFGEDNENGTVTVNSDGLYKLIKLTSPGQHKLRLEFEDNNLELYAFTFG